MMTTVDRISIEYRRKIKKNVRGPTERKADNKQINFHSDGQTIH